MKSEVLLSDCMGVDGIKSIPDNYYDLLLTDVPYGINVDKMAFTKETKVTVKQKNGKRLSPMNNKIKYPATQWDNSTPSQQYFNEVKRISKHQIIFGSEYVDWIGMGPGRIVWNKMVADGVSFKKTEEAYCSMIHYSHEIKLLWSGMMQAKSLLEPTIQQGNKSLNEKRIHPCQKPILLWQAILWEFVEKIFGTRNIKVIDTHLGSGGSRIACDSFGCSEFLGYEVTPFYMLKHIERWEDYLIRKEIASRQQSFF